MSGKLARIEAQEREMLAKMGVKYTQPIEQVVQDEWTQVKSKKRSKKDKTNEEDLPNTTNIVEDSLSQVDYQAKSKKKAKKQRKLDSELSEIFESALSTETKSLVDDSCIPNIDELNVESKSHKKKSKKDKKSKHITDSMVDTTLPEATTTKTSKRKRLVSEAQTDCPTIVGKKKSKKHRKDEEPEVLSGVDQFMKSEPIVTATDSDREADRKTAKAQRKKERQIRRLAKEMDREMQIL